MYIKALSYVEDAPAARKRWGVDATEYTAEKIFPQSYKELQESLQESGEYGTPIPILALLDNYDWKNAEFTVLLWLMVRRRNGEWIRVLLSNARVFIMNDLNGDTIDTIQV